MKLEYLGNLSNDGKYKNVVSENLIRLYDFSPQETEELTGLIYRVIIVEKQDLNLSALSFVQPLNCQLVLQLSTSDQGILKTEKPDVFVCNLTSRSYEYAIMSMKIVSKIDNGYDWLCETSVDNIDFLYSPGGTWGRLSF